MSAALWGARNLCGGERETQDVGVTKPVLFRFVFTVYTGEERAKGCGGTMYLAEETQGQ